MFLCDKPSSNLKIIVLNAYSKTTKVKLSTNTRKMHMSFMCANLMNTVFHNVFLPIPIKRMVPNSDHEVAVA